MSRRLRQALFAALIACHALVTLCGPSLHDLAGSSHAFGPTNRAKGADAPAQPSRDSGDNCLICHFVAQGQLTVAASCDLSAPLAAPLEIVELPTTRPLIHHLASSPRAPPADPSSLA